MGLIYQFYNLIPVLDVVENMTLPALLDGRKVEKSRVDQMLDLLGLKGRAHHLPNQLSGGQQQRVSIGRALINSPTVVLADGPTGKYCQYDYNIRAASHKRVCNDSISRLL